MSRNSNDDAPGYVHYNSIPGCRSTHDLLIPASLKEDLDAEERRRDEETLEAIRAMEQQELEQKSKAQEASGRRGPPPETVGKDAKKKLAASAALHTAHVVWLEISEADAKRNPRKSVAVFNHDQAIALLKRCGEGDEVDTNRLQKIYDDLLLRGTTRRLLGRPRSLKPLEDLAIKQPHFKEVVQFVTDQMVLARYSSKPLRLQPMALFGEPGVGKTHFAGALARALETSIYIQSLDVDLTGSFLLGEDRKWRNSQHGMLFEQVVRGQYANPVVVLDELDKAHQGLSYSSPLASLHSALEPLSAKSLRDISIGFEFDASLVTWIATANHAMLLDAPLRSRFKEFHILPPNAEGCLVVGEEVMRAAIQSAGIKGFSLDVSLRRHLAHLPARQIWQLTREAMGRAVRKKRKHLIAEDLPEWLFDPNETPDLEGTRKLH